MYRPVTIEELLNAKEGEQYQFKEAKFRFDFEEAVKCCCALSNCGGGKLVFGITDKRPRSVVGSQAFEQPERTREGLRDRLKVEVDFQLYEYQEKRILAFEVAGRPIGLPVQADGVAWWYEGDSLIPMPEEVRRRVYAEAGIDFSSGICPMAGLQDLDESCIEVFRRQWVRKSGNERLLALSDEQLLRDCSAITDEGVTYAALILFGKPASLQKHLAQSEIIFEYRSSEASGPAGQREEFREGFFSCYDKIWNLINLRNEKQHYQEGLFVYDVPTFNERVVREAVLNAVSHRNYQMGGSIFVRQYHDRLRIESPGGFPVGITLENILDRQLPRNRRIAEILALCGLVERSGQGMNLMYELSIKEAKQLPDFSGTDEYFVNVTLNGLILDAEMLSVINRIGSERWATLTTADLLIVNALYHEKPLKPNMRPYLPQLVTLGIVEHIGRNKYVLARSLYKVSGKAGTHTRMAGLDRDTNKELLVKHIRESGIAGSPFRELQQVLPGLNRGQIQVLLRELRKEERIYCKGKTNGAKWFFMNNCN